METICIKTKIKPDCAEAVRKWFSSLNQRHIEVEETMASEGIVSESAFLDLQGKDLFLIYYIKAENVERAYEVFENSTRPIDVYFKECWAQYCDGRVVLEPLLNLELL